MIRFINVVTAEYRAFMFPVDQIRAIHREEDGRARLTLPSSAWIPREIFTLVEEFHAEIPFDDLIPMLNGLPPSPLILDLSKSEQDKIRRTLNATQRTLDEIQPRLQQSPAHHVGLDSDVWAVVNLLEAREWAEHCTGTELGGRLERAITVLMGHNHFVRETEVKPLADKLQQAERLLRQVHELVTDGGMYPIDDEKTLTAIGDFLRK